MVTNFEKETVNLTKEELKNIPIIINILSSQQGKEKAVKAKELCRYIFLATELNGIIPVKLRKYVSYIRKNSLLPIIATSKGYYVSHDLTELQKEIKSLNERASAIRQAAKGLEAFTVNCHQTEIFTKNA
jgi:hypothetical protein